MGNAQAGFRFSFSRTQQSQAKLRHGTQSQDTRLTEGFRNASETAVAFSASPLVFSVQQAAEREKRATASIVFPPPLYSRASA
eukprot:scaffold29_cov251-Pinguiococcus_pyrenoidosus.AAC.43